MVSAAGCSRSPAAPEVSGTADESGISSVDDRFPYSFTDSTGASVSLPSTPKRVAVLFSSYADIWTCAGGEISVTVGESVERGFADENAVLVDPGAGHTTVDLEALIAAEPDFVIGTADYACQVQAVEFCRSAGIPAALFRVEHFSDYRLVLEIFCKITDRPDLYEKNGAEVERRIQDILDRVSDLNSGRPSPEILFVRAGSSAKSTKAKTSEDHFACRMLSELGAVNIADTETSLTGTLSLETVLEQDPDRLLITTMGDETAAKNYMDSLLQTEGWRNLTCVRDGKYAYLPKDLFHFKPNARWADAYLYLATILYPEFEV